MSERIISKKILVIFFLYSVFLTAAMCFDNNDFFDNNSHFLCFKFNCKKIYL